MAIGILPLWVPRVAQIMAKAGVPWRVWVAIGWNESGFNPFAHNKGTAKNPEDSVGIFQLNRNGGQGSGHSVEELQDPITNATIAAKYIGPAVAHCGPENITCIAVNSGHPGQVSEGDNRVQKIKSTYNFLGGFDFATGVGKLIEGSAQIPDAPSLPDLSNLDPVAIGHDLVTGAGQAIRDWWHRLQEADREVKIKMYTPVIGWATGVTMLGMGLYGAVVKSAPGQITTSIAKMVPNPYVSGAGSVVEQSGRLFGGSSGSRTIVIRGIQQPVRPTKRNPTPTPKTKTLRYRVP